MKYFNNAIVRTLSIFVLCLSTQAFALSEQASEGEDFYLEASCTNCHGIAPDYDPKNKKAKDLKGLQAWVSACDASLEIGWFPEEQQSVVKYLNESYYKFEK